jgi:PAS domain S-box-containing protein
VSRSLGRAREPVSVARALLEQVADLLAADFSMLAAVDEDRNEASGVLGLAGKKTLDWWAQLRLDLDQPSGIARAISARAPVAVEDVRNSTVVSRELARRVDAKSAVFVPLLSGRRVVGVLVVGTSRSRRSFTPDELSMLEAVAAEGALALDRERSAADLAQALERERLVARIARKVRSELDLDAVLEIAVAETGRALDVMRCFIRLGGAGEAMPVRAEWDAAGIAPIGDEAERLAASNLAALRRTTVAIADVAGAEELDEAGLGGRAPLLELGVCAVVATPIVVFDELIGVFALQRSEVWEWSDEEVSLAEAVAREVGLAIHTARLLRQSEDRLEHLSALLKASQAVAGELRLDTVLDRLVTELTTLLRADAADCYLYDRETQTMRCAAVHGLDRSLVGFEAPADRGLSGRALSEGRSLVSHHYEQLGDEFPHPAYEGFAAALVAPMAGGDELAGVVGVGTRDAGRRFDEADRETIEAFAGLAYLALRNAQSFEERDRGSRIERAFYRVASVLAQSLSLPETLDALAQAATDALGGAFAAVLMPEPAGLVLAGSHELPAKLAGTLEPAPQVLVDCSRRDWVLAAGDAAGDSRLDDEWRRNAESRYRSLLAIPIEPGEGDERGLVLVFFADRRSFTDDDLELARRLADAAKGALERSRLFERERAARALSQQLARVSTFLATELEPDRVVREVVTQAPSLLGADACTISIAEGDELVVLAAHGEGTESAAGWRAPSTAGLAGEVAQSRAPVAVALVEEGRKTLDASPVLAHGYDAYLGVPLSGPEGGFLGVLSLHACGPREWRAEEIEAVVALAGNASAALSNAELYQRVALEKERSDAILANVADGIVAVDREGRVVLWNAAAEQITGIPRTDALGRDPADVLKRSLVGTERELPGGSTIVSIPRGGEDLWLSVSEAVMRDPTGAVAGRIFAFRDVSAERLVEQMKSDFVSTVSHQLRAPLTSIYGFAATLLRDDVLFGDEERRTFLRYISSESERLTSIVDTLLTIARLEAGDLKVTLAPTDLHALVAEVVRGAEAGPTDGHEFVLDLPDESIAAEADEEKLRQVLVNLLDNAVKFSPYGGRVTISARRKADAGTVELAVADEGMGIPQAEQQLIFSKFYRRSEVASHEAMGAGLGLFVAHGLVSAMGGKIRVSSMEGHGSSFALELPLAQAVVEEVSPSP